MERKKHEKADDPDYIYNPKTKRYVLRRNRIGKRVEELMSKGELVSHINHHATNEMLKNRDLLKSDLSNDQLADILRKLVDIRIDEALAQSTLLPSNPPKLKRQNGEYKTRKSKPKPKRRFVVKQPPPQDTTTDADITEPPTDTDYGHSNHWNSDSD